MFLRVSFSNWHSFGSSTSSDDDCMKCNHYNHHHAHCIIKEGVVTQSNTLCLWKADISLLTGGRVQCYSMAKLSFLSLFQLLRKTRTLVSLCYASLTHSPPFLIWLTSPVSRLTHSHTHHSFTHSLTDFLLAHSLSHPHIHADTNNSKQLCFFISRCG